MSQHIHTLPVSALAQLIRIAPTIALLSATPSTLKAHSFDGNAMVNYCTLDEPFVLGFVTGALAKSDSDVSIVGRTNIGNSSDASNAIITIEAIQPYCLPNGANVVQAKDVFCKYLRESPAHRHRPSADLLAESLKTAWECPK
jgi:hypothetical protein